MDMSDPPEGIWTSPGDLQQLRPETKPAGRGGSSVPRRRASEKLTSRWLPARRSQSGCTPDPQCRVGEPRSSVVAHAGDPEGGDLEACFGFEFSFC